MVKRRQKQWKILSEAASHLHGAAAQRQAAAVCGGGSTAQWCSAASEWQYGNALQQVQLQCGGDAAAMRWWWHGGEVAAGAVGGRQHSCAGPRGARRPPAPYVLCCAAVRQLHGVSGSAAAAVR